MTFKIYRNRRQADRPWFYHGRLPVHQRLIFIGNWFILLKGK